jgi:hypothetical protein
MSALVLLRNYIVIIYLHVVLYAAKVLVNKYKTVEYLIIYPT